MDKDITKKLNEFGKLMETKFSEKSGKYNSLMKGIDGNFFSSREADSILRPYNLELKNLKETIKNFYEMFPEAKKYKE